MERSWGRTQRPITSNLFASLNQRFGSASAWEKRHPQRRPGPGPSKPTSNFAVVQTTVPPAARAAISRATPAFGEHRIGGFAFGNSYLAVADMPPQVQQLLGRPAT